MSEKKYMCLTCEKVYPEPGPCPGCFNDLELAEVVDLRRRVKELEGAAVLLYKLESYLVNHEDSCCFEETNKEKCDCGLSATLRDIYSLGLQEGLPDKTKGTYLAVSISLTDENTTLRQQLQFATSELAAAKLVVEAAANTNASWRWKAEPGLGYMRFNDIESVLVEQRKALEVYGSQFPGEEK